MSGCALHYQQYCAGHARQSCPVSTLWPIAFKSSSRDIFDLSSGHPQRKGIPGEGNLRLYPAVWRKPPFLVHTLTRLGQGLFAKLEEDQELFPGMRVAVSYLRKCCSQCCQVIGMTTIITSPLWALTTTLGFRIPSITKN